MEMLETVETARIQHPNALVAAVPTVMIDGMNRHQLLAGWLEKKSYPEY